MAVFAEFIQPNNKFYSNDYQFCRTISTLYPWNFMAEEHTFSAERDDHEETYVCESCDQRQYYHDIHVVVYITGSVHIPPIPSNSILKPVESSCKTFHHHLHNLTVLVSWADRRQWLCLRVNSLSSLSRASPFLNVCSMCMLTSLGSCPTGNQPPKYARKEYRSAFLIS